MVNHVFLVLSHNIGILVYKGVLALLIKYGMQLLVFLMFNVQEVSIIIKQQDSANVLLMNFGMDFLAVRSNNVKEVKFGTLKLSNANVLKANIGLEAFVNLVLVANF